MAASQLITKQPYGTIGKWAINNNTSNQKKLMEENFL